MIGTVYRDAISILALLFMVALLIVIIWLNPPTQEASDQPPGNITVTILWPEGNTDVDLWVSGPAEPRPVGYSNKGGVVWNLLRDDLGNSPDALTANIESSFARGIIAGEYRVNVMCYRCPQLPVPVQFEVRATTDFVSGKNGSEILFEGTTELTRQGQEKTAVNWKMDDKANVDEASVNNIFKPLRSAQKESGL